MKLMRGQGVRPFFFMEEMTVIQDVMDLRFSRQGWRCWACNKKATNGKYMGWAILRKNYPPEIIMWDTIACKELLERQEVI